MQGALHWAESLSDPSRDLRMCDHVQLWKPLKDVRFRVARVRLVHYGGFHAITRYFYRSTDGTPSACKRVSYDYDFSVYTMRCELRYKSTCTCKVRSGRTREHSCAELPLG